MKHLNISLGRAMVGKFSDGEVMVELLENVRGKDVFVLQSTCAPTNDNLMEVMVMVDALKRSSAARVTAAIPYFGYARQDRRPRSARVAISAKVVANMLTSVGVARVLTMDLHADQIQGFFDMPVDNIYAAPVLLGDVWKQRYENLIVVSPDVGGVVRARALAKRLESDLAIIDKRRPKANVAEVMNVIGEVKGRTCVIMDDMVDTAGTLVRGGAGAEGGGRGEGGRLLHARGAVRAAVERIENSAIDELVVTDTIPLREDARACKKIRQLSVAGLLAETILRICTEESVSSLFMNSVDDTRFGSTTLQVSGRGSAVISRRQYMADRNQCQRARAQGTGASRRLRHAAACRASSTAAGKPARTSSSTTRSFLQPQERGVPRLDPDA